MAGFLVRPIGRGEAAKLCREHPHAETLPNSSKYYFRLDIGGRVAGLAVWGYGIMPKQTPRNLFGGSGDIGDYLELCRFFVFDWVPRNTPSKFLAITHRVLKKYQPQLKWLYTYAAGFQGLVGHIYKGSGYDYIGRQLTDCFLFIPGRGLVHRVSLWHRYSKGDSNAGGWQGLFPGSKKWCGYNFKYIYWLCDKAEKERLMATARFKVYEKGPTEKDLEIWTIAADGAREDVQRDYAKTVPIVRLSSKRRKHCVDVPPVQGGKGGSTPTPTLQPQRPT